MTGKSLRKIIQQLLVMCYMLKKKDICPAFISKHNSNHEKQTILLMILNGKGLYYLAVKKLSVLLRRIT